MTYTIQQGSQGIDVKKIQSYINIIRTQYPMIPLLQVDGIFGSNTKRAVTVFQGLFSLKMDGIIGSDTWDSLITEFKAMNVPLSNESSSTPLQQGSTGLAVQKFQMYLNDVLRPIIPLKEDGIYGANTYNEVMLFQANENLSVDGLLGNKTWNRIIDQPQVK